jgi:UDP-N-acetylglucosamine 2-epimerase
MLNENNLDLENIELIDLMPYKKYLDTVYHCKFLISDSGTGQEEPAFFNTPVIVPRDYTERPQSIEANCSFMLNANSLENLESSFNYIDNIINGNILMKTDWMGDGNTSDIVIEKLQTFFNEN